MSVFLLGFLSAAQFVGSAPSSAECSTSCDGAGDVQVDMTAQCMCIEKNNCFKVSIGLQGPNETTSGSGTIGEAHGDKYQTVPAAQTVSWHDQDALSMGIQPNDAVGKWIHKTHDCTPAGVYHTAGCIGVPCEHWAEIKAEMGKSLYVCHGSRPHARPGGPRDSDPIMPGPPVNDDGYR